MHRILLMLSRFCFSAWVGAAALFVVNGIRLVTSPQFAAASRTQAALIRFPAYYVFGFCLVGVGSGALWGAAGSSNLSRRAWRGAVALSALSLGLMIVDYVAVYQPLRDLLLSHPAGERPPGFTALHRWSTWINTLDVGCIAIAAILVDGSAGRTTAGDSR